MSKDLPQPQQSEEVDLGQLFKLIGNAFDKLFRFIESIFTKFFLAFVWLVFFVKKHILKLVIAGVVGVVLGVVLEKTSEPVYKSYITVKQNYDTGENLYNAISYYNDLVKQEDIGTLKEALGIKSDEAASISDFEIESVISENQKLKEFDDYLQTLDTSLAKTVVYKDFLKNLKDYSHQYQQITIKAKERKNFKTVFNKIISNIDSNTYFKREQTKDLSELKEQAAAISKSLIKSDTLLAVYQKAIVKSAESNNDFQAKITIDNKGNESSTKEFELYAKDLELRQDLVEIERKIANKEHIIEITSSKQDSGTIDDKEEFFGIWVSPKIYYALILTILTFIVLLGLNFVKFLERYKNRI
ncbi:hypothetical protein [Flavivirga spongiicola]|uniref:Polysaccharide chain length determinant N-terminal domain-containing protein n=1 Tax=Flavivirga spongiicola TaxID=421621 RepID=A0ABU7XSW5_9FLAO|nr:hypothetical protein [Flavivirga sp. MEBiC05379]MDO5978861.1 hypothetical protein [Flavivirga sp. MEBiC05379]